MNLGIVGVGPWGRVVASSFEKAGVTLRAYDRGDKSKPMHDLGSHMPWEEMVKSYEIDIIACAAPPPVTTVVLTACQTIRKPCFLTKPLMLEETPKDLRSPVYVDYVHLASPLYEKFKKSATRDYEIEKLSVTFEGNGPVRGFPGVLDYGAHALAMIHDLVGLAPLEELHATSLPTAGSKPGHELVHVDAMARKIRIAISTGNGAPAASRRMEAQLVRGPLITYQESGNVATMEINQKVSGRMPGHDPLGIMVERFIWDCEVGRVNPYFLELSASVTRSLREIRESAGLSP